MTLTLIFGAHVLLTVALFTFLKLTGHKGLDLFRVVLVNYGVCIVTGLVFALSELSYISSFPIGVFVHAAILGLSFVSCFTLIGYVANNVSVTLSTLSAKLSFVLPVIASVLFWSKGEEYNYWEIGGISMSLVAIFLASYRSSKGEGMTGFWWVVLVFFATGFVDGFINYSNFKFGDITGFDKVFPIISFSCAFFFGLLYLLISKRTMKVSALELGYGAVLGAVNYFSIFTMILVLAAFDNNGALTFPLINVAVIVLGSVVAFFLFKERLSRLNLAGLIVAVSSLISLLIGSF